MENSGHGYELQNLLCGCLYVLLVGNRHDVDEGGVHPRHCEPFTIALRSTAMPLHLNHVNLLLHVSVCPVHAHCLLHAHQKRLQTNQHCLLQRSLDLTGSTLLVGIVCCVYSAENVAVF